jgi:hypothetical protein
MNELLLRFRDDAQLQPFAVFTAGRSRTMWLSAFLSYGVCACNFEAMAKVANFQEVMRMLSIPGMGAAETMSAPAWPLLLTAAPQLRVVVVRRPTEEILASLEKATAGKLELDLQVLRRLVSYIVRALEKLSAQPQTLTVQFADLSEEEVCKKVFEHCLPYKFDAGWWEFMRAKVVDPDVIQLAQLYAARQKEIRGLGRECRHLLFKLGRQGYMSHLTSSGVH